MKSCAVLVAAVAFAGAGRAADPVDASHSAAERDAERTQAGKPALRRPAASEFEPPPVPEFMLRKPAQPLTLEEMRRQAEEAAEKSRRARARAAQDSSK